MRVNAERSRIEETARPMHASMFSSLLLFMFVAVASVKTRANLGNDCHDMCHGAIFIYIGRGRGGGGFRGVRRAWTDEDASMSPGGPHSLAMARASGGRRHSMCTASRPRSHVIHTLMMALLWWAGQWRRSVTSRRWVGECECSKAGRRLDRCMTTHSLTQPARQASKVCVSERQMNRRVVAARNR